MIHFRSECQSCKSGLNITVGKWWISFIWVSVDLGTNKGSSTRFRFRLSPCNPKIFYSKENWNIIEGWLFETNYRIITREMEEDLISYRNTYKKLEWFHTESFIRT